MRSKGFSEANLLASICRDSFFEFFKEFWDVVSPEPLKINWHIEEICWELQTTAERVFLGLPRLYDGVCNISPGTTKSSVFSIAFQPWTWTRMPQARHITASHTEALVLDHSRKSRDIVKSDKYRVCFPDIKLRTDQDTKGYWANTLGGDRFCCTVGGKTPMGMHAHFLNIDDPLDPEKAISPVELKRANYWLESQIPSRKVDKLVSVTWLVMQRLAQGDPAGEMLDRKSGQVKKICLPAELTSMVEPVELAEKYVEGLMDPVRLTQAFLKGEQLNGEYHYAGQYLQNPVPLGGGMFKIDLLNPPGSEILHGGHTPYVRPPDIKTGFKRLVRYWDKACTPGGGAFSVGLLMGLDREERYWFLDVIRGQWNSGRREQIIGETAKKDGKKVVVGIEQEPGSGGKESAENTAKRLAGYRVRIYKPSGDGGKTARADPLSVQVNIGNAYVKEGRWNKPFIEEMQFFPYSRFKDQIDAASGAFTVITKSRTVVGALC